MSKKENYVIVCPKCGSSNVSFEQEAAYVATGLLNQFKQCNNCGYHGMIFPEVPRSQVKEIPKNEVKEKKNVKLEQTSFGEGYSKFIIYILIPFILIAILLLIFR